MINLLRNIKFCRICKVDKNIQCFPVRNRKNNKVLYRKECNSCLNKRHRERNKTKEEIKISNVYINNRLLITKQLRTCVLCGQTKAIDEFHKQKNSLRANCKKCRKEGSKQYYQNHKKERTEYKTKKYQENIDFRLQENLRSRTRSLLKINKKQVSAIKDLGCTIKDLKERLELMFYPHPETGEVMSWENYGIFGWHVDHIKPLSKFKLQDKKQQLEAIHYTNLQPMWAFENLSKGNKT